MVLVNFMIFYLGVRYISALDSSVLNIDCATFSQSTPQSNKWMPVCDPETNHLVPLQQYSDGTKFCVNPRQGAITLKPSLKVVNCDCVAAATVGMTSTRVRKMPYTPQCDRETGEYLSKQCDAKGTCWCVNAGGMQLGPKYGNNVKRSLVTEFDQELQQQGVVPRPSCDFIRKHSA